MVADTNLYAERKITSKGNLGSSSRFRKWKRTNGEELLAFFGLTINMGIINKSNINTYWNNKDWSQSTPAFGAIFTRDTFLMLHSMLPFPENEGDTGKLKKVQNLVQHFSEQFGNYYVPKKNVSIDESLIGYEGGGPAIQYMPNKHHHCFGFKLFCLYESESGYTYNFSIYQGKQSSSHSCQVSWINREAHGFGKFLRISQELDKSQGFSWNSRFFLKEIPKLYNIYGNTNIFCYLELKRDTFMVHCGKYLVISYIFDVFILQKAMLFSQSRGVKFQKFSGPSAPTMVGPP